MCKFIDNFYESVVGLCYIALTLHRQFLKNKRRNKLMDENLQAALG
jgi:hypothetical protein